MEERMRRVFVGLTLVGCVLGGAVGCRRALTRPVPTAPIGELQFHFTRKIEGPLELTMDGTRVAVEQVGKKGFRQLLVTGLPAGKHRFYLSSPRESFGPDMGEIEVTPDKGIRLDVFAQHFQAVLYGNPEPLPPAEGLPGVRAVLKK